MGLDNLIFPFRVLQRAFEDVHYLQYQEYSNLFKFLVLCWFCCPRHAVVSLNVTKDFQQPAVQIQYVGIFVHPTGQMTEANMWRPSFPAQQLWNLLFFVQLFQDGKKPKGLAAVWTCQHHSVAVGLTGTVAAQFYINSTVDPLSFIH